MLFVERMYANAWDVIDHETMRHYNLNPIPAISVTAVQSIFNLVLLPLTD
jgi:hypothetical protein